MIASSTDAACQDIIDINLPDQRGKLGKLTICVILSLFEVENTLIGIKCSLQAALLPF